MRDRSQVMSEDDVATENDPVTGHPSSKTMTENSTASEKRKVSDIEDHDNDESSEEIKDATNSRTGGNATTKDNSNEDESQIVAKHVNDVNPNELPGETNDMKVDNNTEEDNKNAALPPAADGQTNTPALAATDKGTENCGERVGDQVSKSGCTVETSMSEVGSDREAQPDYKTKSTDKAIDEGREKKECKDDMRMDESKGSKSTEDPKIIDAIAGSASDGKNEGTGVSEVLQEVRDPTNAAIDEREDAAKMEEDSKKQDAEAQKRNDSSAATDISLKRTTKDENIKEHTQENAGSDNNTKKLASVALPMEDDKKSGAKAPHQKELQSKVEAEQDECVKPVVKTGDEELRQPALEDQRKSKTVAAGESKESDNQEDSNAVSDRDKEIRHAHQHENGHQQQARDRYEVLSPTSPTASMGVSSSGYGSQGYMHMYSHPVYSPYGMYPPPYHPFYPPTSGYHHPHAPPHHPMPHMMHPHMVPPPPPPHPSAHGGYPPDPSGGSPTRTHYHSAPHMMYPPYPPTSPVVSPNNAATGAHGSFHSGEPEEHKSVATPPRGASSSHHQQHEEVPPHSRRDNHPKQEEQGHHEHQEDQCHNDENTGGSAADGNLGSVSARVKVYVKPSGQASEEVLARRARKNAQSRARAAKHRERMIEIEAKQESERTPEEIQLWEQFQMRRQRKNDRSRERALEKKEEIDRILTKPEKKRTRIENQFLDTALGAKKRKNEGDRLRRHRLKELGLSPKGSVGKPGISARGPLPAKYQQQVTRRKQQTQVPAQQPPSQHSEVGHTFKQDHDRDPHGMPPASQGHNGYSMPPPPGYSGHMMPPTHHHHHHHHHDPHAREHEPPSPGSMYSL